MSNLASDGNLTGSLSAAGCLSGSLNTTGALSGTVTVFDGNYSPYEGDYEVTPTDSTQTLSTQNRYMTANVVINPIPSNYGLITWDGSVLTVS